ncbi:MAG TPA: ABC transporter permease [Stellaceae bacterium]|nr:ABC transporter permease [Stellaceae bacterium]
MMKPGKRGRAPGAALVLPAITILAYLVIIGPIAIVVIAAFSPTEFFVFPPPGLSLRWFVEFFRLDNMRSAFALSLELALSAASLATILASMAALALVRRRGALAGVLQGLFLAPLVFPTIILGLALLLFYKTVGVGILPGLVLAHVLVGTPYCFRSVLTSLQSFDFTLEEAGQSLGAGPFRTFFLVTLPVIWPGVVSGWFFAFIVSFGELNTALFLTGPGETTLPIEIFSYLQFQGSQLVIAAASALQVGLILVLILAIERLVGLARLARS